MQPAGQDGLGGDGERRREPRSEPGPQRQRGRRPAGGADERADDGKETRRARQPVQPAASRRRREGQKTDGGCEVHKERKNALFHLRGEDGRARNSHRTTRRYPAGRVEAS